MFAAKKKINKQKLEFTQFISKQNEFMSETFLNVSDEFHSDGKGSKSVH